MSEAAERLRSYLTPQITSAELARKLGVSQQLVYNWTHGLGRPDIELREKIEELTGVPASTWLTENERSEMIRALGPTGTGE